MRQINLIGDPKTGKLNFFNNDDSTSIDIKQFNQHLIEVQAINASGTGITAYRPGPINTFSTFKPGENYIAIAKGAFSITLPNAPAVSKAASTANFTVKGNSTAQRGKPTIFVYPYARPQLISNYNDKISLVYSPNTTNSFLRSYRPFSTSNGFEAFEQGKGYIVFAKEDFVIANPDVAQPIPTATPTPLPTTAPQPSPTPWPSPTPYPGITPKPTGTPIPSPTALPAPTAAPTSTPLPSPTAIVTATPPPTRTPVPTPTFLPTATPVPTSTRPPDPSATLPPTATPVPTPIPPTTYDIEMPVQATEGSTVTVTFIRRGPNVGSTITRPWSLYGSGIVLADFVRINGATPTALNGNVVLAYQSIRDGVSLYSGSITLEFKKDKLRAIGGFETLNVQITKEDGLQYVESLKIMDKVVSVGYEITGRNDTIEATPLSQTIKKTNVASKAAFIDVPWSITGSGINLADFKQINDVAPTTLSGLFRLYPVSTTSLNENGGYNYSAVFTINFSKNKDKAPGGKETISLNFSPSDAPAFSKAIDIFDNPPVVYYEILGPSEGEEGQTIDIVINRKGGGQISATRTATWSVNGTGINVSDFARINGTSPSKLNGTLELRPTGVFNIVGGREYQDKWQFQFAKNKDNKVRGGYETFTFKVDDADSKTASKSIKIYDKAPPPTPKPAPYYRISGTQEIREGAGFTFTITGYNLPAGVHRVPFTFRAQKGTVSQDDFVPSAPLTGELTFPGSVDLRTESIQFSRVTNQNKDNGKQTRNGFEDISFHVADQTHVLRILEKLPPPTPTPTPLPAPVQPVLASLTPTGPGRPCVGTKPNCTNGSVKVTHSLGSINGVVQNSVTVYVNDKASVSRTYALLGARVGVPLELEVPGLTGGQTYSIRVVNDAKQTTGTSNVTIPAYV